MSVQITTDSKINIYLFIYLHDLVSSSKKCSIMQNFKTRRDPWYILLYVHLLVIQWLNIASKLNLRLHFITIISSININIIGITKLSRSRSRSMLSKSNAESLNKFGLIGEADQKSAKSRKVFIILSWRNISHSFSTGFKLWLLWREFLWRKPEVGSAAKCCSFYVKTWMFGMTWCSVITNIQYVWKLNFSLPKMQQHLVSFESTVLVKGRLYGNVNLR